MDDYKMAVDCAIAIFLRKNRMNQEQLAQKLGMNVATLSAKRRGQTEFKMSEFIALSELMGMTPDQILGLDLAKRS